MEDQMAARTTRKAAREAAMKAFTASLDRIIPADESKPLKGGKFIDWEDQVEAMAQAVLPTVLEQRAMLEESAEVQRGGRCPHCGSDRVYLEKQTTRNELIGPHGPVEVHKQHCRCHCCGGSFSPSEP
jgi:DNA-directed RNA polymerase subunit RPC12/RpoP